MDIERLGKYNVDRWVQIWNYSCKRRVYMRKRREKDEIMNLCSRQLCMVVGLLKCGGVCWERLLEIWFMSRMSWRKKYHLILPSHRISSGLYISENQSYLSTKQRPKTFLNYVKITLNQKKGTKFLKLWFSHFSLLN